MIGKDATTAFFGGVYDHSNAAHNVRNTIDLVTVFADSLAALGNETRRGLARRATSWFGG